MRQKTLRPQLVEFIPEQLEDGVLYVSQRYRTAMHRCCCGCGNEVVTPLGPAAWTLDVVDGVATLYPSVGNWSLACRSHYVIRRGRVVWARDMSREEVERDRLRDHRLRDAHFARVNRQKEADTQRQQSATQHIWLARLWRLIRTWFRGAR